MKKLLQVAILSVAVGVLSIFCFPPVTAQQPVTVPATQDKPATATAASDKPTIDVRQLFLGKCATCHGKDGRAHTFKGRLRGAQDLTDPIWQDSTTVERVADIITIGKGSLMPAFGKKLSADEIAALAGYVRQMKK